MAKLIIQPHGRLNDWVADEKGYFTDEGLDYEINVEGSRKNTPRLAGVDSAIPLEDNRFGAFERYAEGHGHKGEGAGDVSCACHWTVNQAARLKRVSCGVRPTPFAKRRLWFRRIRIFPIPALSRAWRSQSGTIPEAITPLFKRWRCF